MQAVAVMKNAQIFRRRPGWWPTRFAVCRWIERCRF